MKTIVIIGSNSKQMKEVIKHLESNPDVIVLLNDSIVYEPEPIDFKALVKEFK